MYTSVSLIDLFHSCPWGILGSLPVDTGEGQCARGAWLRGEGVGVVGGSARFCVESAAAAGLRCGTKEIRVQHEP